MKALVATVKYLLLVDLVTYKVKVVESHRPEYYGISWWPNSESLVLSHSAIANDSLIDLATYVHSEKGYLSYNNTASPAFLSQPHQIICAPNDRIIATNTGRNCITLFDTNTRFYKDIRVNDVYWDRLSKEDACGEHFNSVFLKDNHLYVLAHRFKKSSHILKYSYPDGCLIEKFETMHRFGLHNIWVDEDGKLIACNSDAGELIHIQTNETLWSSGSITYTRGLAATKDTILVGGSDIVSREHRNQSLSQLWVIDRKTYTTTDYLPLGNFGSVHEVRILDEVDEAHHGSLFAGLSSLEQKLAQESETHVIQRPQVIIQEKIQNSQKICANIALLQPLNTIITGFNVLDNGWLSPKDHGFALSLFKNSLKNEVNATLDYRLTPNVENQSIGLVFGYKGPDDSNMVVVLISYDATSNQADLALWINSNNEWRQIKTLLNNISKVGNLTVQKLDDVLKVKCNGSDFIAHEFNANELHGYVGIRGNAALFCNQRIDEVVAEMEAVA